MQVDVLAVYKCTQRIKRLAGEEIRLRSLSGPQVSNDILVEPTADTLKEVSARFEVVGRKYIFEVVEEVRDSLAFGVSKHIVVVYFRRAYVGAT